MPRHPRPSATAVFSETRSSVLEIIKREGSASIAELSEELRISYETVRQQILRIQSEGWIEARLERRQGATGGGVGRPTQRFFLTGAGEHLFPKHYDALSVELIDAVLRRQGIEGLRELLGDLADTRVRQWAPRLAGMSLEEKIEALKGIYLEDDPFMSVDSDSEGALRLVEHNCPFLNVAKERPALCSLTVAVLSRLLGYRVSREKRFQAGDGRCVFRLHTDRPVEVENPTFTFEDSVPES